MMWFVVVLLGFTCVDRATQKWFPPRGRVSMKKCYICQASPSSGTHIALKLILSYGVCPGTPPKPNASKIVTEDAVDVFIIAPQQGTILWGGPRSLRAPKLRALAVL